MILKKNSWSYMRCWEESYLRSFSWNDGFGVICSKCWSSAFLVSQEGEVPRLSSNVFVGHFDRSGSWVGDM